MTVLTLTNRGIRRQNFRLRNRRVARRCLFASNVRAPAGADALRPAFRSAYLSFSNDISIVPTLLMLGFFGYGDCTRSTMPVVF